MQPIVSVICPVRNEEKYIGECLGSLTDQTYPHQKVEILVVDGLSDDRTREIVQEFQNKFDNIRLLNNPNRIVPCALNIGIANAEGEYILRMDGHAKAAKDYIENSVKTFSENSHIDCIGGPIISVNETETGKAIALAMSSPFGVGNSLFRTSKRECLVDTVAFPAYRRRVFTNYGVFDEELIRCQDDEFNYRLRKLGGKILLTPKLKSWYFPRTSFRRLWKQYFGYGFWKIRVLQKHLRVMQMRQLVPAAFVVTLISLMVLWFVIPETLWVFVTLMSFYWGCTIVITILACFKNRVNYFPKVILSFIILHFSYGFGFLWGLIRFSPNWLKKEL